jgi:hypothetical protein
MTFFDGRTARARTRPIFMGASGATRKTASHFCWPMLRLLLLLALGTMLTACGVKNDLVRPDGTPTPKSQNDPSKPPYPLGR